MENGGWKNSARTLNQRKRCVPVHLQFSILYLRYLLQPCSSVVKCVFPAKFLPRLQTQHTFAP
jgi:hypothetical protein